MIGRASSKFGVASRAQPLDGIWGPNPLKLRRTDPPPNFLRIFLVGELRLLLHVWLLHLCITSRP